MSKLLFPLNLCTLLALLFNTTFGYNNVIKGVMWWVEVDRI